MIKIAQPVYGECINTSATKPSLLIKPYILLGCYTAAERATTTKHRKLFYNVLTL